ncbi:MAG: prephenate/arogenate dehydrogenase family protein [Alphaproteobacteria bacterium]|nr:prephenate/arogenate dehydrogenase family protein [Alphaproteobacteria bacterium]
MFERISIIGMGLIGSSLARAIRVHGLGRRVVCVDRDPAVCETALRLKICDEATVDAAEGVQESDLVVFAVPVGAFAETARVVGPVLKAGAIVTDVGSVKQVAANAIAPHLPDSVHFVPGHPIAGTEQSGPESGFHELFINRWCVLTPLPETDIRAVEKITAFWEACGSRIEIMDPHRHDIVLAITSHLPHLIAYTIVGTATDLEEHLQSDVIKFSASGFRDFTRIAASDPVMWRDVFLTNKDAVLDVLQRFNEDLSMLQRSIRWQDGRQLEKFFTRTRNIRRQVIEAGQADYVYPSKGGAIRSREGTPPVPDQSSASGPEQSGRRKA